METITVNLSSPIVDGDKTITELTFREPDVGDMMVGDSFKGDLGKLVAVLASIADVKLATFKKVKARDMSKIMIATAGLVGNDQFATTGEEQPQ